MSPIDILNELVKQGIIPTDQQVKIAQVEHRRPFSLHWELRSMLYIGILLLSGGLGLLVYDNFDQIGHGALLIAMAAGCVSCFAFAWRFRPAWTMGPINNQSKTGRSTFGDYALLLGCLLFLTLEGYAQYQYTIFGTRYGLVTLLPAVLFLPMAYRFDHRGVLGMALTALVSWVGVTVRPLELYFKTNFFDQRTVLSAILLALMLIGIAMGLEKRRIKPHFTYTYLAIAGNLLLVALLGGLFNFENQWVWFAIGLATACFAFDRYFRIQQRKANGEETVQSTSAFLFLLMSTVYGYIGVTYLFFHYLYPGRWEDGSYYWYFILTGIGVIAYLMSQLPKGNNA